MALKKIGSNKGKGKSGKASTLVLDNSSNLSISKGKKVEALNVENRNSHTQRQTNKKTIRKTTQVLRSQASKPKRKTTKKKKRKIIQYQGHKADTKGIKLRKREVKLLKDQVDYKEHAGGFDYDVKTNPKTFIEQRGKKSSVFNMVSKDDDFEVIFHTHPVSKYDKSDPRFKREMRFSSMPSPADVANTVRNANQNIRDRSLLVTPDKKITEIRVLDPSKTVTKTDLESAFNEIKHQAYKDYPELNDFHYSKDEDKEIMKAISQIKRQWKKALLDKYDILLLEHGSSQEIKLDQKIIHSGAVEKKFDTGYN